jgi:O-antigen chain-terminating methyltransferase
MNLQKVVYDIRGRLIREAAQQAKRTPADRALFPVRDEIARLRVSYDQLSSIRNSVGRMPPSPNTLRAKAGAILVRMVQRMLFWYTPQIQRFNNAAAAVAETAYSAMEKQTAALQRLYTEVADIRSEVRVRSAQVTRQFDPGCTAAALNEAGFDHFLFALQNSVLGPESKREAQMQEYIVAIDSMIPPIPEGPWLDLSCGRGDWLKAVRSAGREGSGLESNAAALSHCESLGLNVVGADPIAHLRQCAESSFAVISAFHVLNRYPARPQFELIRESVRALKPGGVLILESSDPANLLAGAHEAWSDPTHLRPMPAFTAEFLLEYFGLCVIMHKALNAVPEEQRLPFAELDLVRQLNSLLYGPRTYGLVARRPAATSEPSESKSQGGLE